MKTPKIIICVILASFALMGAALAETDVMEEQAEALDVKGLENALPESAADYMDGMSVMDSLDLGESALTILTNAGESVGGFLKQGLKSAVLLLCVVLLCGVVSGLFDGTDQSPIKNYVPLVGAMAIIAISVSDLSSLIGLGRQTIESMDIFSKALLPTLAAAASAGGAPVASGAKYVATAFFADILISVIKNLLIPLMYAYIAACAADAVVGNGVLSRIATLIKSVATWVLSTILIVFTAYLSLTGVISGTTDAVALKATKTAISAAVPVVGSIISDASETVLAGASVLKNAIGVFGALAIVAMCLTPFLRLGIHYLIYKLSAAVSGSIGDERLVKLIDNLSSAFGVVLAMTASCALMLFISVISTVSALT